MVICTLLFEQETSNYRQRADSLFVREGEWAQFLLIGLLESLISEF
jgi:hypothetical protein